MFKFFSILLTFFFLITASAQINMQDSTAQVVAYWSKADQQKYDVTFTKYKQNNKDSIGEFDIKYKLEINVIDSADKEYVVEWYYKDFEVLTDNKILEKFYGAYEGMRIKIKTNEFGALSEILNWDEIEKPLKKYVKKAKKSLRKEFKSTPDIEMQLDITFLVLSSKEYFINSSIKDIQQFHTFHGGAYKLNEKYSASLETINNFGGKNFDTDITVSLDEINEEGGYVLIRSSQTIDSKQLTAATYSYLKANNTLGDQLPSIEVFPSVTNETWVAAYIHSASGWPIRSSELKETASEDVLNVELRVFQITE